MIIIKSQETLKQPTKSQTQAYGRCAKLNKGEFCKQSEQSNQVINLILSQPFAAINRLTAMIHSLIRNRGLELKDNSIMVIERAFDWPMGVDRLPCVQGVVGLNLEIIH